MKTYLLMIVLWAPLFLSAQISLDKWMTISPVSDSSHNNRNACMYGNSNQNIVFWEQELDNTTTQICYKELDSPTGIQVALVKPGIKLTNPEILDFTSFSQGQVSMLLLYQTTEGSDINIGYITRYPDGSFSDSKLLTSQTGDDINMVTKYSEGQVSWENNGKIWISAYNWETSTFTPPYLVDSAGSNSPVFTINNLNYIKPDGDSTLLISKSLYFYNGNWLSNFESCKTVIGTYEAPSSCSVNSDFYYCMEQNVGMVPTSIAINADWSEEMEFRSSPEFNLTQPVVCSYSIAVKSGMYFLAYITDSLGQPELIAELQNWYPQITNISNWAGNDRNPRFFQIMPYYNVIRLFLFWESEREGFSTIYSTYYDYIFGGMEETHTSPDITAIPSPFDTETMISLESQENVQVLIFDLQGKLIKSLKPVLDDQNRQKVVWDGTSNSGSIVPTGSYLLVAGTGKVNKSIIIIKK